MRRAAAILGTAHQYLLTFLAKPETKAEMRFIKLSTEVPNAELAGEARVYAPPQHRLQLHSEKSLN